MTIVIYDRHIFIVQATYLTRTNPLAYFSPSTVTKKSFATLATGQRIRNPSDEPFEGKVKQQIHILSSIVLTLILQ